MISLPQAAYGNMQKDIFYSCTDNKKF